MEAIHLYRPSNNEQNIIDASKHIFLTYYGPEDTEAYHSNEELYIYFANALDAFLLDYQDVYGIIPKVNLIGHSRGGLVNMLYAINHPQVIASFMSVGTPFLGSDWADIYVAFQTAASNNPNYVSPYAGVVGGSFAETYATSWNYVVGQYGFPTKVVGCSLSDSLFTLFFEELATALLQDFASMVSLPLSSWINDTIANLTSFIADVLFDTS